MIQYHIIIISKNNKSIKNFFIFFNKIFKSFNIIKKCLKKKHKRKILTILKSPHVNKASQEQFEIRLFTSQISIYYSMKNLQLLLFLKKIKVYLFPDIKLKIKFSINKLSVKKFQSKIVNPDNFRLSFFNNNYKNERYKVSENTLLKKTEHLLKIFDIYGNLIKTCLDSSVGRAKD